MKIEHKAVAFAVGLAVLIPACTIVTEKPADSAPPVAPAAPATVTAVATATTTATTPIVNPPLTTTTAVATTQPHAPSLKAPPKIAPARDHDRQRSGNHDGSSMSTATEIMNTVGERLAANKEAAGAIGAIYKFVLEGEGGGTWVMDLKGNATLTAGDGPADCTLAMSAENGVALFEGKVSGEQLFFGNQLRVEGDMSLALRLQSLLAIVR